MSELISFCVTIFGENYYIKQFLLQESDVGKTLDGRTSVTVKMGKTRDRTVRDIYVTDPWQISCPLFRLFPFLFKSELLFCCPCGFKTRVLTYERFLAEVWTFYDNQIRGKLLYGKKEVLLNPFQCLLELAWYHYVLFAFERFRQTILVWSPLSFPIIISNLQTCILSSKTFAGERMTKFINKACFTVI